MDDEDSNFHGVVVALAIVIVFAGLIEIVRFFSIFPYDPACLQALGSNQSAAAKTNVQPESAKRGIGPRSTSRTG